MEKSTVLARIRFSMSFSEETQLWFHNIGNYDLWFAREGGDPFFREFSGLWREVLRETVSPEIENYFRGLELPGDHMPRVDFGEEYSGSWIVDTAITMAGTVGTVYTILKGVSDPSCPRSQKGCPTSEAR